VKQCDVCVFLSVCPDSKDMTFDVYIDLMFYFHLALFVNVVDQSSQS